MSFSQGIRNDDQHEQKNQESILNLNKGMILRRKDGSVVTCDICGDNHYATDCLKLKKTQDDTTQNNKNVSQDIKEIP